jgi:hypothetical protein
MTTTETAVETARWENANSLPQTLDEVSLPKMLPPLMLVAFTRPDLLQAVLQAIRQQTVLPPQIIAFVDGARKPADLPLIEQSLTLLQQFTETVPVQVIARPQNLGCDRNVILGLTEVLSNHESVIYLEDDIVPNRHFYERMARLLTAYRDQPQVASISAYASLTGLTVNADIWVSNRVFPWGMGLWADRWQALDLANHSGQYNPFQGFHNIPPTVQTKLTLVNQFWLEKNQQTDWAITFTLAALHRQQVHLVPQISLIHNIGFGHPEAKTYRGQEPAWVNAHYDAEAYPNQLPASLDLLPPLQNRLSGPELACYLSTSGLWLNLQALFDLLQSYPDLPSRIAFCKLFLARLPRLLQRWRSGRPV